MANQLGMVFARLDCKPRWRERLAELAMPTLVVHGHRDPLFPVGNGKALARDPRCTAPRTRTGLDGDPRCIRRSGRDGDRWTSNQTPTVLAETRGQPVAREATGLPTGAGRRKPTLL